MGILRRWRKKTEDLFGVERSNALQGDRVRISDIERSLDFHFFISQGNYIENSILPLAASECRGGPSNKFFKKKYSSRLRSFKNMTANQLFWLELDCLARLNREMRSRGGEVNFPVLYSFSTQDLTITMSDNGVSLSKLNKKVKVRNLDAQVECIINTLNEAQIVHLDMSSNKNNITVNEKGTLSVIDFDMAQVGDRPFNWTVAEKMRNQKYRLTKDRLYEIILTTKNIDII